MKTNYFLKAIFILSLTFSCSTDAIVEDETITNDIEGKTKRSSEEFNGKSNCGSIIPVLITSGPNVPSGEPNVYVTAGVDLRSYPREVTVTVISDDDNSLLDQINLMIPANQSLSNFLPIINCYGEEEFVGSGGSSDIRLSITSVRNITNNNLENCYVLTDMDFSIPKCPKGIDQHWYIIKGGNKIQFN